MLEMKINLFLTWLIMIMHDGFKNFMKKQPVFVGIAHWLFIIK